MDAETTDLLRASIRELLDTHAGDIATKLDEFGFIEVLDEDPAAAIDLLFHEQGAAGKASSSLDLVAVINQPESVSKRSIIHPLAACCAATRAGDQLHIDGVTLGRSDGPAIAIIDGAAIEIPADAVNSGLSSAPGFDPASALYRVHATLSVDAVMTVGRDWDDATSVVRRALASELVGNGTAMLKIAVEQITERTQFGRPIGANQSPRHRLAETYALLGGAAGLVHAAWRSGNAWDARVAKTYAGYAVEVTGRACLQVCGAIGLTTEHRLPGYVKRGRVLDALYGGWQQSLDALGTRLLDEVTIPCGARI